MEKYHFISDLGKTTLPISEEIDLRKKETGEEIILVLDSSVCIDIRNFVDGKQKTNADFNKMINLIEYAQKNKIETFSLYALLESCYDRTTLEIDSKKFIEFKNKIDFAFSIPAEKIKEFGSNFTTYISNLETYQINNNALKLLIDERLNIFYAALLKIAMISKKGLSSKFAERNINEFVDWMLHDLDVILGAEYMLAQQIFGGNSKFQTMLKLGSTKERMLKAAWGTAWDFLHSKFSRNKEQISILVGRKVYPIFVTKDESLSELISPQVTFNHRNVGSNFSITEKNKYPNNYSDEFMQQLNQRMFEISLARIGKAPAIDINKTKNIIIDLEEKL